MKKKLGSLLIALILGALLLSQEPHINSKLTVHACKQAGQMFGTRPIDPQQEKKIREIAHKMNIKEAIVIRRANASALQGFGYYNAFMYFPAFLRFIPTNAPAHLFVSEGFFEDLSQEEQVFLIGHELTHIKERHTKYIHLGYWILLCLFLLFWWRIEKWIRFFFRSYIHPKRFSFTLRCIQGVVLYVCVAIPNLSCLAYRRHMERVADIQSIEMLKSHNGALKLIDKWQNEYHVPENKRLFGLLSDHPLYKERKSYCLAFKKQFEGTT